MKPTTIQNTVSLGRHRSILCIQINFWLDMDTNDKISATEEAFPKQ